MNQAKVKLNSYQLYDKNGFIVPGAVIQRPLSVRPRDSGLWKQIPNNICCTSGTFITFSNTTASANITAIKSADGAINWTGTLANGQSYVFAIPNGYDETFSVTVDTPSGRTITTAVSQQDTEGTATISAVGAITLATNSFSTNVAVGAQFTAILS